MTACVSPTLIGIGNLAADIVVRIESLPVQKDDFTLADEFRIDAGEHAMLGRFGSSQPQELSRRQQEKIVQAGAVFASGYSLPEQHLAGLTLMAFETAGKAGVLRAFDPGPSFSGLPETLQKEVLR